MKLLKKYQLLLLSVLTGLLLSLAWPQRGIPALLFIAFIPMLILEDSIYRNRDKFSRFAIFFYTFPGFFVWNFLTTWWIYHASFIGAVMAILFNSLFMAVVFHAFHRSRSILNRGYSNKSSGGYFILVVFWMSFEYLHLNWELTWPWLQLGNGFASAIKSIQWYEYTGAFGGTLWMLAINVLLFKLLKMRFEKLPSTDIIKFSIVPLSILVIPVILSWFIYQNYKEANKPISVLVIQPNVDPYGEKFKPEYRDVIWDKLLGQTLLKSESNPDFIVWPETSIPGSMYINQPEEPSAITKIKDSLSVYLPESILISGGDVYEIYDHKKTSTARAFPNGECCWDAFNTALEIDTSGMLDFYHKSKLVPGVERMPYPNLFGFLEKFAIDLGGTSGSMGTSPEPKVFSNGIVPVAPVICFESVFGEYVAQYVRKGAELIFIITNDGWWGDTPGYRQHFSYASLRAIETRRSIARSANTGISGYINQRGDVIESVPFWEKHAMIQTIHANNKLTVYVRFGDYLGRIAVFSSFAILLIMLIMKFLPKRKIH
jgi:apolipoprotein N-acyltransferase